MASFDKTIAQEKAAEMAALLSGSGDGYTAKQLFGEKRSCHAYTYDDIILMPGHVNFGPQDVSLETNITKNIRIKVPMLSSPMDTVTEHEMAIGNASGCNIRQGILYCYVHVTVQGCV